MALHAPNLGYSLQYSNLVNVLRQEDWIINDSYSSSLAHTILCLRGHGLVLLSYRILYFLQPS